MSRSSRPSGVTNTLFQPAISYLARGRTPSPHPKRSDSIDDPEASSNLSLSRQTSKAHSTLDPSDANAGIPLITFSRSPSRSRSPYPRSRSSAAQSEDEDDDFGDIPPATPLFGRGIGGREAKWWKNGSVGRWLFGTKMGWEVWVGLLCAIISGSGFELVVVNQFILLSRFLNKEWACAHSIGPSGC
jgi:hypothetical protein